MKKTQGFTLIEFIIALTIGAIIIMGTGFILANGKKNQMIQKQKEEMQRNATDLGNLLSRYMRNLGSVMCLKYPKSDYASAFLDMPFFSVNGDHSQSGGLAKGFSYKFKFRKSFVTQEQIGWDIYFSDIDYVGRFVDVDANPFIFSSNCIDTITHIPSQSHIVASHKMMVNNEIYIFDSIELYHDPSENELRLIQGRYATFYENVTSFKVFTATRLADTTSRDPEIKWRLMDSKMPFVDIVAIKFIFTLQPPKDVKLKIDNKTYEVVATIRNIVP